MAKYNPVSTYRLQFNKDFTLKDAESILPYLYKTGIKTIYASPVFEASKGSLHGYDVTNPLKVNPEIGTDEELEALTKKVHDYGMGWIQDIVPNHMAFSVENPWIYDVLEKGRESEYYTYFDILDNHPDENLQNRLMLPFFGKPLEDLLESNELSVVIRDDGIKLKYFETEYPLSVPAYFRLLQPVNDESVPEKVGLFLQDGKHNFDEWKEKLFNGIGESDDIRTYLNRVISEVNHDMEKMRQVIDDLYYYPSFWRDTETKINYRRFFTINSLICLNIQHDYVFKSCHAMIARWIDRKMIDGLRVDHIDGLFNPSEYLERLRKLAGEDLVIYVEKILERDEYLPGNWPIEGSTGYDFLGMVNNLLTKSDNGPVFHSYYNDWIKKPADFENIFYNKSRFILYNRLSGELDNLTMEWNSLPHAQQVNLEQKQIREAIGEYLVCCPVYKIYHAPSIFSEPEKEMVEMIGKEAIKQNPKNEKAIQMLVDLFLPAAPHTGNDLVRVDAFFRRCMQFTGPLMAKGIEDTAFYSYNPFIVHNEVGDSPGYFGISTSTFHHLMAERQKNQHYTMNATSTHDIKRGEDARARLNTLSDIPVRWMEVTSEWRNVNRKFKEKINGREIPSANDEYLIYQALCAHLPMDATIDSKFKKRLQEYIVKALREGKVNSSWSDPDEEYENVTVRFAGKILEKESEFYQSYLSFMLEVIPHGIMNSITQLILKNTVPGVPDNYQGSETWNLSFVDPDNRRAVDYLDLAAGLAEVSEEYDTNASRLAKRLFNDPLNGKLKIWMNWVTLQERMRHPDLFLKGSYIPLKVTGRFHKHVMAFYRNWMDQHLVVIVPLNTAGLTDEVLWEETIIGLPENTSYQLQDVFTKNRIKTGGSLKVDEIFKPLPFALLKSY
jgi:(1->4)-alpha-D-glucan 1-alpha-D-glucosylmutase